VRWYDRRGLQRLRPELLAYVQKAVGDVPVADVGLRTSQRPGVGQRRADDAAGLVWPGPAAVG